jgi:adenylate cyclase
MRLVFLMFLLMFSLDVSSQTNTQVLDSLLRELSMVHDDSLRSQLQYEAAVLCSEFDPEGGLRLAYESFESAKACGDSVSMAWAQDAVGICRAEQSDYAKAAEAYRLSTALFKAKGDSTGWAINLANLGALYREQGILPEALEAYHKAVSLFGDMAMPDQEASLLLNIGNVHAELEDHQAAFKLYKQALALGEDILQPTVVGVLYGNLGISQAHLGLETDAIKSFEKSLSIHRELGNTRWEAFTLGNLASAQLESDERTLSYYNQALGTYRQLDEAANINWILVDLGKKELEMGMTRKALGHCAEGLVKAQQVEYLEGEMNACECLAKVHERLGDLTSAYRFQTEFITLSDSLERRHNEQAVVRLVLEQSHRNQLRADSLEQVEGSMKLEMRHQEEIHNKNQQRNIFLFIGLGVLIIAVALLSRLMYTRRAKNIIEEGKRESDALLRNILPDEVAEELKANGEAQARQYAEVSILFSDFASFTQLAERLTASELVAELNVCFRAFDEIMKSFGVEKIKTIGDAYMACAGLDGEKKHALTIIRAAQSMQEFMINRGKEREEAGQPIFEMRIGIHSGPVVAGIVGTTKFQYDLWGDAVNIASRMESAGEVGKINISEATFKSASQWEAIKVEDRGEIEAKNKGKMRMFFVKELIEKSGSE